MQKYNRGMCQVGQGGQQWLHDALSCDLAPLENRSICLQWAWAGDDFDDQGSWHQKKCRLDGYYLWCFLLTVPSSGFPSTRSQSWNSSHREPLVGRFLLWLKIKSRWKEYSSEASEADLDSNLPLSGCGLLASYFMFLSLNFWIETMGIKTVIRYLREYVMGNASLHGFIITWTPLSALG